MSVTQGREKSRRNAEKPKADVSSLTVTLSGAQKQMATNSAKNPVLVFASADGKIEAADSSVAAMAKRTLALYGCQSCKTSFIAEAGMKPFCITCGDHRTTAGRVVKNAPKLLANVKDSSLAAVSCGGCKSNMVMSEKLAANRALAFNCVTCGTKMLAHEGEATESIDGNNNAVNDTLEAEPEMHPERLQDTTADLDELSGETDDDDDEDDLGDLPDDVENVVDATLDEGELSETEMSAFDDMVDETSSEIAPSDVDFEDAGSEINEEEQEILDDAMTVSGNDPFSMDEAEIAEPEYDEGTPVADVLGMDDDEEDVMLVSQGASVVAMKGMVSIATLSPKRAGDNLSHMHSKAFQDAVVALAKSKGLRKALATLRFKPIKIKTMTIAQANERVKAAEAKAAASLTAYKKDFRESLVLAAVGLDRGKWSDGDSPMVKSLATALQGVGYRQPQVAARKVCSQASEEYISRVFEVTSNLLDKGPEFRKMIAETFKMTKSDFDDAAESDGTEDYESEEDLDDLGGITSNAFEQSAVSASTHQPNQSVVVSNLVSRLMSSDKPLFGNV